MGILIRGLDGVVDKGVAIDTGPDWLEGSVHGETCSSPRGNVVVFPRPGEIFENKPLKHLIMLKK